MAITPKNSQPTNPPPIPPSEEWKCFAAQTFHQTYPFVTYFHASYFTPALKRTEPCPRRVNLIGPVEHHASAVGG
ncbi:MAG TPA: hypothetical protein VN207_06755, partial [Ktedonobacteraceae bacterium]|nr:hypothetical protein [Ktedonobacteraceae bacterium]